MSILMWSRCVRLVRSVLHIRQGVSSHRPSFRSAVVEEASEDSVVLERSEEGGVVDMFGEDGVVDMLEECLLEKAKI